MAAVGGVSLGTFLAGAITLAYLASDNPTPDVEGVAFFWFVLPFGVIGLVVLTTAVALRLGSRLAAWAGVLEVCGLLLLALGATWYALFVPYLTHGRPHWLVAVAIGVGLLCVSALLFLPRLLRLLVQADQYLRVRRKSKAAGEKPSISPR